MISIIVPTIRGREHWYRRCSRAYFDTTEQDFELIPVRDRPSCGVAWNEGAEKARGDYLHFSADDLEPHSGWDAAAVAVAGSGKIPCPLILNENGTLQSCGTWGELVPDGTVTDIARVPFCSRTQWQEIRPIIETHYYTDNHFAHRAMLAGIPTVVCHNYLFTHHFALEGRLGADRMQADHDEFVKALA